MTENNSIQILLSRPEDMSREEWRDYQRLQKAGLKWRLNNGTVNYPPDQWKKIKDTEKATGDKLV